MKHAIIFSTTYFPLVGGAEVALREITERLPEWELDLVCARIQKGLADQEKIGNVMVHRVGFGIRFDKFLLPFLGPLCALRMKDARQAVVWSLMASFGGYAALVYAWMRPSSKVLLTLQEGDPLEHYERRAGRLSFTRRWIFRRANVVQAISHFLAEWAMQMGFYGTPEVVPNGVDLLRFSQKISSERRKELRQSFGFSEDDLVLVTASRLSLKNGIDDLIRSLSALPLHVKALVVGEGEDREKLAVLVKEMGLQNRVVFVGKRGHDELPGILQSGDIFIRASLSEGLGNSFLEAMAAGLPIIGTPVGGIPDFLTDGDTGVFCQPRDPASIAAAVMRIQSEPGLRERIIQHGLARVQQRYGWDGIARRMDVLLTSLIT